MGSVLRKIKADNRINSEFNKLNRGIEIAEKRHKAHMRSLEHVQQTIDSRDEKTKALIEQYNTEKAEKCDLHLQVKTYLEENTEKLKQALLKEAENSGAEHALKVYEEELKIFEQYCSDFNDTTKAYKQTIFKHDSSCKYLQFLRELIQANKHFCVYLPIEATFSLSSLFGLSNEELDILEAKFEKAGGFVPNSPIFNIINPKFLKYFPNKIKLLDDIESIIFCLKLDINKYTIVRDRFLNDYTGTFVNFTNLINCVPDVIKYFKAEEFKLMSTVSIKGLDLKLKKNPDLINYFPTNFFSNYDLIKSVFRVIPKTKLIEIFGDRLDRFPELKKYAKEKAKNYPKVITSDKDEYSC